MYEKIVRKELASLVNTPVGFFFLVLFTGITGLFLWVIPGTYNIKEGGYATLDAFFSFSPVLLIVLIPALSMKTFSEEKKTKTLYLLCSRPIKVSSIVASKMLAVFSVVLLALALSLSTLWLVGYYALPTWNVDWGGILGAYLGMILFSLSITSLSVFASSVTSSQIVAYIIGVTGSFVVYYGFDLIAALFSGSLALQVSKIGMLSHVLSMKRGVIEGGDLCLFASYITLFFTLSCFVISVRKNYRMIGAGGAMILLFVVFTIFYPFRWDVTAEKRYTLSKQTKEVLEQLEQPVVITSYLEGDLNPGFLRLKQALKDWVSDGNEVVSGQIQIQSVNPYQAADPTAFVKQLHQEGIQGIAVNERNKEGGFSQKTVYPWVKIMYGYRSLSVPLLIHQPDRSGEENLNASIENIEYQLTKAVSDVCRNRERKIAFLEGHGELEDADVQDITDRLSKFYTIDRGQITGAKGELDTYEAIVIAGPQQSFSEEEKFVLDQYLMQGGKILLLVNGALLNYTALAEKGETPSMVNETNLGDWLFQYGVRINPVLLQDKQCLALPVSVPDNAQNSAIQSLRWLYAPVLNPNGQHPVTKNILHVKSEFVSSIDFTGKNEEIRKTPLLYTSSQTREVKVPEMIRLAANEEDIEKEFEQQHLIAAAVLEGRFTSVFNHRSIPSSLKEYDRIIEKSPETKLIVVASEEIARNDRGQAVGYDAYSQITFGNADFLLNAVNYLTDDPQLMLLRDKDWKLRLLDKEKMSATVSYPVLFTILLPLLLLVALGLSYFFWRIKKAGA